MLTTRRGVTRIIRQAFLYAAEQKKKSVTLVDKSNVLRFGHRIWREVFQEISSEFQIRANHLYVDAAAMKLVRNPEEFDVIVTENMFGDILSDIGAELQGGMGFAASKCLNPETGRVYFEPVHGSAPDIAGKNEANPCASLLTLALLFEHFGHPKEAYDLRAAICETFASGVVTPDVFVSRGIGRPVGTREFGAAVIERLKVKV